MRLFLIIKKLSDACFPIHVTDLAAALGCSERAIESDLAHLKRVSSNHGFQIVVKKSEGYSLQITNKDEFESFLSLLRFGSTIDQEKEPHSILKNILLYQIATQEQYIAADELAEFLGISRSTFFSKVKDVLSLGERYGIKLDRQRHRGMRIVASPISIRHYLALECFKDASFIEKAGIQVAHSQRVVAEALSEASLTLNYTEFRLVVFFVCVCEYFEIMQKRNLTVPTSDSCDFNAEEERRIGSLKKDSFASASQASLFIFKKIYPNTDISEHLLNVSCLTKEIESYTHQVHRALSSTSKKNIQQQVYSFFKLYDRKNDTSFSDDTALMEMLTTHVVYLVDRLLRKAMYKNPVAQEIEITNPSNMNAAIRFANMLSEIYGVMPTADEVSFIAMHLGAHDERVKQNRLRDFAHIGVVCTTGGGSSYLVKLQLESIFPTAEIKTFSYLALNELYGYAPDLIFTMVPLPKKPNVPIIVINEFLEPSEIDKIKETLQYATQTNLVLCPGKSPIWDFFKTDLFFRVESGRDYSKLISLMGSYLEKKGYAQPGFTKLVLERESFTSTIYLNGVCIPHPIETDALKDAIAVCVLERAFLYKERTVRVIFLICLKKDDVIFYKPITRRLYSLMRSSQKVSEICQCRCMADIVQNLKESEDE